jgi:cyclopropane fatty-acyl-phospholipid synthase-like methyltransferase
LVQKNTAGFRLWQRLSITFLASIFGVAVEGYDLSQINVDYANARAKLLRLSDRVTFFQQDLKGFVPAKKYDVVASLGIEPGLYGGREAAFNMFHSILNEGGVLLYAEAVWTKRPVNPANSENVRLP